MDITLSVALAITGASLLGWVYLLLGRGFFWRMDQRLNLHCTSITEEQPWPAVGVVVPARNEAEMLPNTLPLLLNQDYPGPVEVFLVDDCSTDCTGDVACGLAGEGDTGHRLTVVPGEPLAQAWTGKMWALEQGVRASSVTHPEFILLTDADIAHPSDCLGALVSKARSESLDLVSLMARLRVATVWERLLIPAFVFFFGMLYPFPWVNNSRKPEAAAAGGCVLLRREALERAGGLAQVAGELIDDCALAGLIKRRGNSEGGRTWLGLHQGMRSLRPYTSLAGLWELVSRTAFTQLRYSLFLLLGTVLAMLLLYGVPVLAVAGGLVAGSLDEPSALSWWLTAAGLLGWILMAGSYLPTLEVVQGVTHFGPVVAHYRLPIHFNDFRFGPSDVARGRIQLERADL